MARDRPSRCARCRSRRRWRSFAARARGVRRDPQRGGGLATSVSTAQGAAPSAPALPELASVYWRPRATERSLSRAAKLWTLTAVAHSAPFVSAAVALAVLKPVTIPVGLVLLIHAWVIPELYAARGAGVVRASRGEGKHPERVALGLLGDLVDHRAREVHARTGL